MSTIKRIIKLLPYYDRIIQATKGVRNDYSPKNRDLLSKYGNQKIKSVTIFRKPIFDYVHVALGLLSAGQWQQLMKKYGFDNFFHLGVIVELNDGNSIKIEKNEVIELTLNPKITAEMELMYLKLPNIMKGVTLNRFLDNTRHSMGTNYFPYDPFKNNCQVFVMNLLNANSLLSVNPGAKQFIYQDIEELSKELSSFAQSVSGIITDIAGRAHIIVHGKGIGKRFI